MIQHVCRWEGFILICMFFLTDCSTIQLIPPNETAIPGVVNTYAAQTLAEFQLSSDPQSSSHPEKATSTPFPTSTVTQVTAKSLPSTGTPLPTLLPTIVPTPTELMRMPDGSLAPCNALEFVQDVTIPDGSLMKPGQKFTKVWELKNIGNCTWTKKYSLVLEWGNLMGTDPPIPIGKEIRPGENLELSVQMAAPYIPACWVGWWKLQDEQGNTFGLGYKFAGHFIVKINVFIPGIRGTKHFCDTNF
jgi:hypothetical protein